MRSDVVVFVGPTIGPIEARAHLNAIYLPPVSQGDVVRAVLKHRPAAIAIVDGEFAQRPAVRHKEILWAMAVGVQVYGASSMGAIRAAELTDQGMVGHGFVFRWYLRTVMADDAEVAVAMAPPEFGSFALGDALLDIRLTLRRAERERIIGRECRLYLEYEAQLLHFTGRSYDQILSIALLGCRYDTQLKDLKGWIALNKVRRKRADAIGLLRLLANLSFPSDGVAPRSRPFEVTEAFLFDLEYSGLLQEFVTYRPH
ncbi:TfuA-like protein [Mesorhizobium sp. RSR380A]|uniref:TfuA-like protein n=1 Tax=unclassified Mesorhizobium TaxID=325217 RepID=UPI0003CF49DD|nr:MULTISPECIES: TfuA-like protein [unclassified Mesorhizobium]ESW62962.1 hypothetical protein X771_31530 [Mesorhizobium sp. LSJC277A00]ESX59863.1 hypothetical protein X760_16790 [Mesorhizobium sp. LSHC422A00]ESY48862.1 hypothetical protein X746_10145 [Mesorhizobium sp. LNJC380A00]